MAQKLPHQILAVAAGKGGVGKSSVSLNIALALSAAGARVGVLDADLYGPSLGRMIALDKPVQETDGWILPAQGLGIEVVSFAHFVAGKQANIVRAPIANQIISQFLHQVLWSDLDFLLIDFPPGTGDIQLTIMQQVSLQGALLVSTPQLVALEDVEKALTMFNQMHVPILGLVENMSYFEASLGNRYYPLGEGGGRAFCEEKQIPFFGEIPLEQEISACCDLGISLLKKHPLLPATKAFEAIADRVQWACLEQQRRNQNVMREIDLVWEEKR